MKKKLITEQITEGYERIETRGGRALPADVDAEKFVLGNIMNSPELCDRGVEILGTGEADEIPFYTQQHRALYGVIRNIYLKKEHPDLITVAKYVKTSGLGEMLPAQYIAGLVADLGGVSVNFIQHCRALKALHVRRRTILVLERAVVEAYLEELPNEEIFDQADTDLLKLRSERKDSEPVHIGKLVSSLDEAESHKGILTNIESLNEAMNNGAGAQPGDFIIIGARPSVGKTSLALNFCGSAIERGDGALFISAEMKNSKITRKLFEYFAGFPAWKLLSKYNTTKAQLTAEELETALRVQKDFHTYNCFFDDSRGLTPMDIRARVSRWKQRYGIGVVFVDYIQLIRPNGDFQNREREISSISEALKGIAMEHNVVMYALSQMNRQSIGRTDKKPSVGDLKDSGALEADADMIILPYDPKQVDTGNQDEVRDIELILAKNRLGACRTIKCQFYPSINRFTEVTEFNSAPIGEPVKNERLDYKPRSFVTAGEIKP